jgi:transposase
MYGTNEMNNDEDDGGEEKRRHMYKTNEFNNDEDDEDYGDNGNIVILYETKKRFRRIIVRFVSKRSIQVPEFFTDKGQKAK